MRDEFDQVIPECRQTRLMAMSFTDLCKEMVRCSDAEDWLLFGQAKHEWDARFPTQPVTIGMIDVIRLVATGDIQAGGDSTNPTRPT